MLTIQYKIISIVYKYSNGNFEKIGEFTIGILLNIRFMSKQLIKFF